MAKTLFKRSKKIRRGLLDPLTEEEKALRAQAMKTPEYKAGLEILKSWDLARMCASADEKIKH